MASKPHRKAVVGNPKLNFWLYDSERGYDLTHPATPTSPMVSSAITIQTTSEAITVDPTKSALVIVDMQNIFLSPALGRAKDSKGMEAQKRLLEYAIPAARRVGMQVVWLNWGLTTEEVDLVPPIVHRVFGFQAVNAEVYGQYLPNHSFSSRLASSDMDGGTRPKTDPKNMAYVEAGWKNPRIYRGLGQPMGQVVLEDGRQVDAGNLLMRGQWNADLTPELSAAFEAGQNASPSDVWIHKNRMSGLGGNSTACTRFLEERQLKTLFFAGVNTDQCVGGSLTDAFSKGYDCILLSDGAATSSPAGAQECYERNAAKTYGFCTSCQNLWDACV